MTKKKIIPVILDVIILAIIILWGLMLYREFQSLTPETESLMFSVFNIKILLFGIFVIAAVTVAFYFNLILGKEKAPDKMMLENYSVSENDDHIDSLVNLEEIRKLLTSKLQIIDQVWERYEQSSTLVIEDKVDEAALLKGFKSQEDVLNCKTIPALFEKVVETAVELTDSERVSLILYNPNTKKLTMSNQYGVNVNDKIEFGTDEGIAGYAFKNVKRLFVNNIENHPELGGKNKPQYHTKSFIVFPIKVFSGVVIGVLNITEKKSGDGVYDLLDLEKINLMMNSFSIKMENMILSGEYSKSGRSTEELKKAILEFLKKV